MKRLVLALAAVLLLLATSSCMLNTSEQTTPSIQTTRPEPPKIEINGIDPSDKENDPDLSDEPPKIEINDADPSDKENDPDLGDLTTFADVIRSKPTRDGYYFAGWYSDEALTDYIDPNYITDTQYAKGTANAKWIPASSTTFQVRNDEVTITDEGRKKQQIDIVELSKSSKYTLLDLERAGFTNISVEVVLDVKEVNDGYQYIFLYKDSVLPDTEMDLMEFYDKYVFGEGTKEDPSLLHAFKHEHTPGEKDTSWDRVVFTKTLRISDLKNDLYIRYGASGKDEDTWRNRNVVVTITPVQ